MPLSLIRSLQESTSSSNRSRIPMLLGCSMLSNSHMSALSPHTNHMWEVHYTASPPACPFDFIFDRADIQTQDNRQNSWFDELLEDNMLYAIRSLERLTEKQHDNAFYAKTMNAPNTIPAYQFSYVSPLNHMPVEDPRSPGELVIF